MLGWYATGLCRIEVEGTAKHLKMNRLSLTRKSNLTPNIKNAETEIPDSMVGKNPGTKSVLR